MAKKLTMTDEYYNEVLWYGGFPLRQGDIIRDLDTVAQQVAKANGLKSWIGLRDMGIIGNQQFNDRHPMPEGTQPITLEEFYRITGIER